MKHITLHNLLLSILATGLLMLFSATSFAWDKNTYYTKHARSVQAGTIRQLLDLPDEEIDFATAVLLISKELVESIYKTNVDIAPYREQIDRMADALAPRLATEKLPVNIIEIINSYIYKELGYKYDHKLGPASLYLNYTLDQKKAVCLTFSLLYLCLAERLNLPLYGVIVPGHMFVRFDDGNIKFNIDQGGFNSDIYYMQKFRIPQNYKGAYLKSFNKRKIIGSYLSLLGQHLSVNDYYNRAVEMGKLGLKINPDFEESYKLLGNIYNNNRVYNFAVKSYQDALDINPKDPNALVTLGALVANNGNLAHGIDLMEKAVEIYPKHTLGHLYLGLAYKHNRWNKKAIDSFSTVLSLEPKNQRARRELSQMGVNPEKFLDKKNPATSNGQTPPAAQPSHPKTDSGYSTQQLMQTGQKYYKLGKYATATKYLEQAVKQSPSNAQAHLALSKAYFAQRRLEDAQKHCIQAHKLGLKISPMYKKTLRLNI